MTALRIGTASADITPTWPISLAGFASRTQPASRVDHPLRVRVAVLETAQPEAPPSRAAILSADLLWWNPEDTAPQSALRQEVSSLTGTPAANIIFSATHTHSGPQTSRRTSQQLGTVDPRFMDLLHHQTLAAAAAAQDLEPALLSRVEGTHPLAMNRRRRDASASSIEPQFDPEGLADHRLTVVRIHRPDGSLKALLVHYACHPVISDDLAISSEFVGVAMDQLEQQLGVTALYLQGCCGDINPDFDGNARVKRGSNADVARTGSSLAGAIAPLATSADAPTLTPRLIASAWDRVDLPFAELPDDDTLHRLRNEPGVMGEWAVAMLAHPEWRTSSTPLRVQRLDLADGLSLIAMNGEIVTEYGLHIRELTDNTALPLGYANGMIGYVPTAAQIAEGGYEVSGSTPYFMLPAPFDPAIEPALATALSRIAS